MTFSEALEKMKKGKIIRRKGWPDPSCKIKITGKIIHHTTYPSYFKNIENSYVNFESSDILANDWEVVP